MAVCVLLVAALAGPPAWGDGNDGKRGHANAQNTASANAKLKRSAAKGRKRSARAAAPKPAGRRAVRRRQQAPAPSAPAAPAEPTSDPTPPPSEDPPPVEVPSGSAEQEEGAQTPAPPAPSPSARVSEPPAQAAPELSSRPSAEEPAPNGTAGAPAVASKETPETGSGVQPPTQVTPLAGSTQTADSGPGGENQPRAGGGADEPPLGGADNPPSGNASNPPESSADPPLLNPGTSAPLGPAPTGRPIQDGPVLQVPAREITQAPSRPSGSSSDTAGGAAVGTLGEPSSLGLHQVANLVKDIPAWITFALAGLAALVLALGAYTVLAAARTRRLQRQRSKLMEDIGLLQAALLPAVPGRLGALLTTVAYRPADGPAAGGDFYDAFALSDGRVALLLGDISGHGRQALAKTTLVRFTVRAHLEAGLSPREALSISGRSLDGSLSDDFSTVIAAIHDPVAGTLTYASAGHPAPLVIGPQAHEPVTASSAPPIGAGFPTGQRQTVLPMPEGSTVAVYSDGLIEARIAGETLGRDRLSAWLAELGPEATAKALLDLVVQRADRVPDDLAAVVLHAARGSNAPAARVEQLKLDVLDVEGPALDGFLRASGVSRADRAIAARRVSEQLAVSGGVVVEVRIGEHPMVSVASIGDHVAGGTRVSARTR